jgi:nucleotide-binding universal stress UspA family protein
MPTGKFAIHRILVALDTSPQSLAALRAAIELAVKFQAQLQGLFVEDIDLLRLAGSPYAREVLLPTAKEMPLDRTSMERKLKAHAEQARQALAKAADQAKVEWAFRVVRGSVASEILAATAECDLLALGWRGWSLYKKSHAGSTASAAMSKAVPVLLVSSRGLITGVPVFVWYDGTLASKRGVLAAAELARVASQKLTVLLPSLEPGSDDHLQEQVMGLLREKGIRLKWQRVSCSDRASLCNVLRSEPVSLVILTGQEPFPEPVSLVAGLDEIQISVLLLGEGPAFGLE